jgi:hypothetical protein
MKRTIATVSSLTALAAAAVLLSPSTALAGPGRTWVIDSRSGGTQAQFRDVDELLHACDTKADGLRASAVASWTGTGGVAHLAEVQDADGANGNCAGSADLDIVDGVKVWITACDRNGQYGEPQNCDSILATA